MFEKVPIVGVHVYPPPSQNLSPARALRSVAKVTGHHWSPPPPIMKTNRHLRLSASPVKKSFPGPCLALPVTVAQLGFFNGGPKQGNEATGGGGEAWEGFPPLTVGRFLKICFKKGNPGLTQNFSKLKNDITKIISVHDSIISLLQFGILFILIRPFYMDGCTAVNFVLHLKIGFVQVGVAYAAWWHLGSTPNFSKLKKDITKLISVHDRIISLL